MSKSKEKNMAIELRQRGLSYSEILDRLTEEGCKVSKGSLSNWLKSVNLTEEQQKRLEEREEEGKRRGRQKIINMRKTETDD